MDFRQLILQAKQTIANGSVLECGMQNEHSPAIISNLFDRNYAPENRVLRKRCM